MSESKLLPISQLIPNEDNPRTIRCKTCNADFISRKACKSRQPKYCSKACFAESLRIERTCKHCGKGFSSEHKKSFCSSECHRASRQGVPLSADWKAALSAGRKFSEKCKGPKLYNWKGGKSAARDRRIIYNNQKRSPQKDAPDLVFLSAMLKAQGNRCFYCESPLATYRAIEHLTPIVRGGQNQNFNLVFSCKSCNSTKRQKTLEEFAIETGRGYLINKWENLYISASCQL